MKKRLLVAIVTLTLVAVLMVGCKGTEGLQGLRGPAGPQGERGSQGEAGPQGEGGPSGASGPSGSQGEQGPQGETGPAGEEGPRGSSGPKGSTGATGATGPTGPKGDKGDPGDDADCGDLQDQIDDLKVRLDILEFVPPTIDGELSDGEWDDYLWFTDNTGNEIFGGVPEFTYYKVNDSQCLYFAIIVEDPTPLVEANDDIWLAFRLDEGENYPVFRKGYTTDSNNYGQLSETGAYGAYGPLPQGAEFGWSVGDSHICYEWQIPLAFLGINPGETIKYLTHVREWSVKGLNYHPEIIDNENKYWPYADINQFGDLLIK